MEKQECSQGKPASSFPRKTPRGVQKGNESPLTARILNQADGTQRFLGFFWKGKLIPTPGYIIESKNGKILGAFFNEWSEHFKKDRDPLTWLEYSRNCYPRTLKAIRDNASGLDKVMAYTFDSVSLAKDRMAGSPVIPPRFSEEIEKAMKQKSPLLKLDSLDRLLLENWHKEGWMNITLERLGVICGKALKRKPFPKTTMQKRLDALGLQTKVKAGAQPKPASLEAVREYQRQRDSHEVSKIKSK
jgi:hypothetical protein